jgi:hypothetical protein
MYLNLLNIKCRPALCLVNGGRLRLKPWVVCLHIVYRAALRNKSSMCLSSIKFRLALRLVTRFIHQLDCRNGSDKGRYPGGGRGARGDGKVLLCLKPGPARWAARGAAR